jgi:hypothetical protein
LSVTRLPFQAVQRNGQPVGHGLDQAQLVRGDTVRVRQPGDRDDGRHLLAAPHGLHHDGLVGQKFRQHYVKWRVGFSDVRVDRRAPAFQGLDEPAVKKGTSAAGGSMPSIVTSEPPQTRHIRRPDSSSQAPAMSAPRLRAQPRRVRRRIPDGCGTAPTDWLTARTIWVCVSAFWVR